MKNIFSIINGLLIAVFIPLYLDMKIELLWSHKILIFITYFTLGYILCKKVLYPRMKKIIIKDRYSRRIITIISISLSIVIMILNYENIIFSNRYKENEIIITATGEKNTDSLGTEIWIFNMEELKQNVGIKSLDVGNSWEIRENNIVSYQNQPNQIVIKVKPHTSPINIEFLKHNYSGIIEIKTNEKVDRIDLYSNEGSTLEYPISELQKSVSILGVINFIILSYLLVILLVICLDIYFEKLIYLRGNFNAKK